MIFVSNPPSLNPQILISEDLHTIIESITVTHRYALKQPQLESIDFSHWENFRSNGARDPLDLKTPPKRMKPKQRILDMYNIWLTPNP